MNHNLYSLQQFLYKFYSLHRMDNKFKQSHKIHFDMDNLMMLVEMICSLYKLNSLCLILPNMISMNNDKVDKLDLWDYQNNQQYTYIHQKSMFWIVSVKNNNWYILNKKNKWDTYFCKVYILNLYHHHNSPSCKHKIYLVEEFFEMIKDKLYIGEDQDLCIHRTDKGILYK